MGKLLFVNLSDKQITEEALDYKIARDYLGGYGLGVRVIYERQKRGVDPLGEESIYGVLPGPLTGTPLPVVSRYNVVGKSPLTKSWGDANSRGYFAPYLKFSGYDGVFITGIADKPVYLLINDGKAELCDASEVWGKDTFFTEDYFKAKYGKKAEVSCIGPAGEKLSLIAGVITAKGKAAGRSGMGAIMGSKKIKAVVVMGKKTVPIANVELVSYLREKYNQKIRDDIRNGRGFAAAYSQKSGYGYVETGALNGDSPVKNWYGVGESDLKDISQYKNDFMEQYIVKKGTCYQCPMGDWRYVALKEGPYALSEPTNMPEYETVSAFGSYCLNTNYESIIKCNDLCNRYGIDTISTGATIAFAMDCYEKGLITKKDTDGIELTWGNHQAIVKMTEKICTRDGFGDVLADGVKNAAKKIGKGAEKYAIHVGGQELPAHDSRFEPSMASIYKNEATPGRHTQASQYCVPPMLSDLMPDIDFSFSFGNKREIYAGRAKAQKVLANLFHCVSSIGMCLWGYLSTDVTFMPECLSAVTGWDVNLDELLITGERIGNLRLAFALREGVNPIKLNYPDIALGKPPFKSGPTKDITVDLDTLTKEYCEEMGWDVRTGKPTERKLKELGLDWVIDDIL